MRESLPQEGGIISDIVKPVHVEVSKRSFLQRFHRSPLEYVRRPILGSVLLLSSGFIAPPTVSAQELPDQGHELILTPQDLAAHLNSPIEVGGVASTPPPEGILSEESSEEEEPIVSAKILDTEPEVALTFPNINPFYRPTVRFEPEMGYVAADNLRITHQYDPESSKWYELEKYIPIGTAQERMNQSLRDLLGTNQTLGMDNPNTPIVDNPLGLDPNEVETYLSGEKADNFSSFRILPNSKGEPAIILVTGGQYGLSTGFGNIEAITAAVKYMNSVDPTIIDTLTIQFGLRAISADIAPGDHFSRLPGYGSTFDRLLGILIYNEKELRTVGAHIGIIIGETRGIYNNRKLINRARPGADSIIKVDDQLSERSTADKALWLKQWVESYKLGLPKQVAEPLSLFTDSVVKYYSS